jgi:hypothetical protein
MGAQLGRSAPGGAPAPTPSPAPSGPAWNPADKSAAVTLAGFDLIAQGHSGSGQQGVRGTASHTAGKWYYEFTGVTGEVGCGFANASHNLDELPGLTGTNAVLWYSHGLGWSIYNGGWLNFDSPEPTGSVCALAIDMAAGTCWKRNPAGWNGDPAAGTGGYAIPGLCASGPLFPLFNSYNGDGSEAANFGGSAFAYAVPGGFTAWSG